MITKIEAFNFRCLKYVNQVLTPFQILVGPNASGKTTFLDVISFLSNLVTENLESAISERTSNFEDLVWQRSGNKFELAIEAKIPSEIMTVFEGQGEHFDTIRYETAIGIDRESNNVIILEERVLLKNNIQPILEPRTLFPMTPMLVGSIITKGVPKNSKNGRPRLIAWKSSSGKGNDYYASEILSPKKGKTPWQFAFKLGETKSTLGNLPAAESQFPASNWLKTLLSNGVQSLILNSLLIRKASPPTQGRIFKPDGSNLPWVIEDLITQDYSRFQDWIKHVQTALPDIENIRTVLRDDDRHRYLLIKYQNGFEIPSWMVSDGTLRLLTLTLPAYLRDIKGTFLIEEPENGIHPKALETIYNSLSSMYDTQILTTTHSSVLLGVANVENILVFDKIDGATDIVAGNLHPVLKNWKNETDLGELFASGVLG